jgi:linearmycin/streptolysin S transport system ATP-binding protein
VTVLECRDLQKRFGRIEAVRGISFSIAEGETYGLLGPNGAGKTTTISMVCGLLEADAGSVVVAGQPLTTRSVEPKAAIGYVPQELAIYPDLNARENLRFFARLYGLAGAQAEARIDDVLEVIGLTDRARELTSTYSGGMQRRLNIGIGLLHRPRLLILDEPTVGVDPQSRNAILESVEQLAGEGMAVLYTTHYMEEAERLCDRIGIVDGARGMLPELLAVATAAGAAVKSVDVEEPDLEAVFLQLTGRALRD